MCKGEDGNFLFKGVGGWFRWDTWRDSRIAFGYGFTSEVC